jgi:hypothetical protein
MKKLSLNKKVIANMTNVDMNQLKGGGNDTVIKTDTTCDSHACPPKRYDKTSR